MGGASREQRAEQALFQHGIKSLLYISSRSQCNVAIENRDANVALPSRNARVRYSVDKNLKNFKNKELKNIFKNK